MKGMKPTFCSVGKSASTSTSCRCCNRSRSKELGWWRALLMIIKVPIMDEDDVAKYTIKTIDDPRALNKTVYVRPPGNIVTQRQLVGIWENLSGKKLEKSYLPEQDFLAPLQDKTMDFAARVALGHFYHIFYEGCMTNFEIGQGGEEASLLYPDVQYKLTGEYLKQFL